MKMQAGGKYRRRKVVSYDESTVVVWVTGGDGEEEKEEKDEGREDREQREEEEEKETSWRWLSFRRIQPVWT